MSPVSVSRTVRLDELAHDPVILALPGQEARLQQLDDLLASIPAHGLLQSLKVRVDAAGVRYLVTAGNRRLAALRRLRDAGTSIRGTPVTDAYAVAVIHSEETDASAREQAAAENIQRVALTPAAEARQYAELAKHASSKEIAARFGVPEKRVSQRLKLASLHPDVLAALEANQITVTSAEAFTVEPDPEKQAKYLKKAEGDSWKLSAPEVKKAMEKKLIAGTSDLAKLVGREAYLAAGGQIVDDPFGGGEWWIDHRLLDELAEKHWAALVPAWEAAGWAFVVEARAYGQYFYPHNRVTPQTLLSDEAAAEQSTLLERLKVIVGAYEVDPYTIEEALDEDVDSGEIEEALDEDVDSGELSDAAGDGDSERPAPPPEVRAEIGKITARLTAITVASRSFTPEQKAGSGVVYWLDGSRPPVFGFIDPKRAAPPPEERKKQREPAPSLDNLSWDLRSKLADAMFSALRQKAAIDPLFGLQILVAKLHVGLVHGIGHDVPVDLGVGRGKKIAGEPERGKSFGAALNWAKQQDVATLAEAAGRLVTHLVAPPHYGGGEESTAALVRLLAPDLTGHFDVEAYCKDLTVPQLGLVWRELTDGGKPPEPKEIVKRVADGIRDKGWLPPQLRTPGYKGPSGKPRKKGRGADNFTSEAAAAPLEAAE